MTAIDTAAASRPARQADPSFYRLLQMGVADLKGRARSAGSPSERRRTLAALIVRDLLVVLFAVLYVAVHRGLRPVGFRIGGGDVRHARLSAFHGVRLRARGQP